MDSPITAAARALAVRGPKERFGWGTIGVGGSVRLIPKQERFFVRSNLTASSPAFRWIDGELWHGTWEDDESDVRRVDSLRGGRSGKVKAVRRPGRGSASSEIRSTPRTSDRSSPRGRAILLPLMSDQRYRAYVAVPPFCANTQYTISELIWLVKPHANDCNRAVLAERGRRS
jgi:hypothetical protein